MVLKLDQQALTLIPSEQIPHNAKQMGVMDCLGSDAVSQ